MACNLSGSWTNVNNYIFRGIEVEIQEPAEKQIIKPADFVSIYFECITSDCTAFNYNQTSTIIQYGRYKFNFVMKIKHKLQDKQYMSFTNTPIPAMRHTWAEEKKNCRPMLGIFDGKYLQFAHNYSVTDYCRKTEPSLVMVPNSSAVCQSAFTNCYKQWMSLVESSTVFNGVYRP